MSTTKESFFLWLQYKEIVDCKGEQLSLFKKHQSK